MDEIKIFIADDNKTFRDGVKMLLSKTPGYKVIDEAENGRECVEKITEQADVVLMDIAMPEMDGVEATKQVLIKYPNMKVLALTMFGDELYYYKMIHAGACGFVLKEAGSDDIEVAITDAFEGKNFFSKELLRNISARLFESDKTEIISRNDGILLNEKEHSLTLKICGGASQNEIEHALAISEEEFQEILKSVYEKTETNSMAELIIHSIKNKYIL